jgi:hypothetical protein
VAAGHPHGRVGERRHELAQRIGIPLDVGVAEGHDLARRLAHRPVLGRDLAAPLALDQPHAPVLEAGDDGMRRVGGRIRGDDDLQLPGRVVEGEDVLELAGDHVLLVVGRDDQADRRQDRGAPRRARMQARERGDGGRVAEVRPDQRGQARPEDDLDRQDHAGDPTDASRAAGTRSGAKSAAPATARSATTKKYSSDIVR